MNRIKIVIHVLVFIFFTTSTLAQVEPLHKYDIADLDKDDSIYRIKGQKFYRYKKTIKKNDSIINNEVFRKDNDTIHDIKTEDITYYSIYKKRYLFISYYPKEQKGLSFGFSIRRLGKVDVIDLKKPSNKWHFNFEHDKGVSLSGISEFKPETGEIVFIYKFSINTNNESNSIPIHKNYGRY
ncbi:hypothetical protein [Psychroserpens sp. SPM9]|uniref:hypothetical protein n=1 Tax=Psychroserpens sp. SPM9 TaxID=2975598 RepID=UPI0021A3A47E|nr:hypothetical protein [Psychroserpens sp. SPM9]MDG5493252.1 hypothetical protein [Psychroserpens sp. SPM9]